MASRTAQKEEARARRQAEEAELAAREKRRQRLWLLGGLIVVAAVIVVVAVFAFGGSSKPKAPRAGGPDLFAGVPQQGITAGNPNAPVTLVEFADLKCPICREYTFSTLPTLVNNYVRTGKLKLVYRVQTFVGQQTAPGDSMRAARMAQAAGLQNKLWSFAERFYDNQQDETTSYVTDSFLRQVASGVPGLNVAKALKQRSNPAVAQQIQTASNLFSQYGFQGTPSFLLGRTGGKLTPLNFTSFDPSQFTGPINALLK